MYRSGTLKITAVLLALLMISGLSACGAPADEKSGQKPGTIVSETETERILVDQAGREVAVSRHVESIGICYRIATRIVLSLGQGDKVTGIGKTDPFIDMLDPDMKKLPVIGLGVPDVEAVAKLNPDLYFGNARDTEGLEAISELGIAAVGISIESPDEIEEAIDVIGKACGAEKKAAELIEYYENQIEEADEITSDINDKERKTAIVMGSSIGKVADGTMLQGQMIKHAGGINCADELEATETWPTAGTEQIFAWNPDYIFISHSEDSVYSADDILNDKAWSELKAVKNKNVYVIPAELDSWEFPGVVSALGIDFMINRMYPELMSDEELAEKAEVMYELLYGQTFDRSELGY